MFDNTAVHLPFYTTSSPQNLLSPNCCPSSVLYTHWDSSSPMLLPFCDSTRCPPPPLCSLPALLHPVFLDLLPSFSSYYILCLIHIINPSFYIFYSFLFISYTGHLLPCPCQSLCEFYANHCARIEALRRQLQEEQRGRQVEHTATAGLGWYCSWDILCNIKIILNHMMNTLPLMAELEHRAVFCIWIGPALSDLADYLRKGDKQNTLL